MALQIVWLILWCKCMYFGIPIFLLLDSEQKIIWANTSSAVFLLEDTRALDDSFFLVLPLEFELDAPASVRRSQSLSLYIRRTFTLMHSSSPWLQIIKKAIIFLIRNCNCSYKNMIQEQNYISSFKPKRYFIHLSYVFFEKVLNTLTNSFIEQISTYYLK